MRFGIPEEDKTDRAYWDLPLWHRIYLRVFYALFAFIVTGAFFDLYTPAPIWLQVVLASLVALATLLFRMAYPNGFSGVWNWMLEGMAEAQEDAEKKGNPYKGASSAEIRAQIRKDSGSKDEKGTSGVEEKDKSGKRQ